MIAKSTKTDTSTGRRIACLALGASMALSAPLAAQAGQNKSEVATPRIAVPHVPVPGPGGVAGCWSAQRLIYGPHAFSFCTNGRYGSYQVHGGGLNCNGNVTLTQGRGGAVTVQLSRSRCNGRTDWSADTLECRSTGGFAGGWNGGWNGGYGGTMGSRDRSEVAVPRVAVPAAGGRLDCTYYPAAPGYRATGLALVRN
jgi:hypothetical protein